MREAEAPKGKAFLPGTSATTLRKMAKDADNGNDALRYIAMFQRKIGMEYDDIARSLGISIETARRWATRAHREGLAGIPHGKGGQPPNVSAKHRVKVVTDVLNTSPREHRFKVDAWDFRTAIAHLNNVAGTNYSYKSGHRLLKKMGLRLMSPRPKNPKGLDRRERKKREGNKRATLKRLSKEGFLTVCSGDAMHAQIQKRARKALGARHCRPHSVPSTESKGTLTVFVGVTGVEVVAMRAKRGNSREFIKFCKVMLSRNKGKPVVMIVDNAAYQKSNAVNAFRKKHRGSLRVLYLPPRTPEMAIAEQVIGASKRAIARRSPKGKRGVWRALRAAAKAGEIPVFKLYDWMIVDGGEDAEDGGGGEGSPGRQGCEHWPKYARDVTAITLRPGQRARAPPRKRRRPKKMSAEERRSLEKKHFGRGRVPPSLIAKIPDAMMRDIPPALVRT